MASVIDHFLVVATSYIPSEIITPAFALVPLLELINTRGTVKLSTITALRQ